MGIWIYQTQIHEIFGLILLNIQFTQHQTSEDNWTYQGPENQKPEMSKDDIGKEVTKAWAEFTEDADKAKEAIDAAFKDDHETDIHEEERMVGGVFFMMLGGFICILVAFPIYMLVSSMSEKNK